MIQAERQEVDGPSDHATLRGERTHGDGRGVTVREL